MLITLFLLLLYFMKILTGLSVKVLYFYADYFLLITNIVKALKNEKNNNYKKKNGIQRRLKLLLRTRVFLRIQPK